MRWRHEDGRWHSKLLPVIVTMVLWWESKRRCGNGALTWHASTGEFRVSTARSEPSLLWHGHYSCMSLAPSLLPTYIHTPIIQARRPPPTSPCAWLACPRREFLPWPGSIIIIITLPGTNLACLLLPRPSPLHNNTARVRAKAPTHRPHAEKGPVWRHRLPACLGPAASLLGRSPWTE